MKQYLKYLLLVFIILPGCKKGDATLTPDTAPPITIKVTEKFTNKAIAGATVYLKKCSYYDIEFGCTRYSTISTLTTNNLGQVTFLRGPNLDAIEVQHPDYWTTQIDGNMSEIILVPKCTIKASIKKIKTYLPTDVLHITIRNPDCFSFNCWRRDYNIGLPNDTIVYIKGQGYLNNQVSWYINFLSTDTLHPLPPVYVSGFDTASVNIEY